MKIVRHPVAIASLAEQRDQLSLLQDRFQKGLKKGRQEGEQIGIQKGEQIGIQKGIQKIVQKALKAGVEKGIIQTMTGLSLEEIQKIQAGL